MTLLKQRGSLFKLWPKFSSQVRNEGESKKNIKIDPKQIQESIRQLNEGVKEKHRDKKDSKYYMTKMSTERIEKIGSHTILDKQWADKPLGVIRNPHKLTEVELYKTLEKIVELPEKRLKQMLTMGNNAVDEVFLANVITRIPQFLTTTLVNLTKTLLLQKDYFKDHPIWKPLEKELFRRKNNLNNEQLAQVVHAFGVSGNGSKEFYYDLEETIIDSPIPIETEHLEKILLGYSQIDQGTPSFYSSIVEKIIHRGIDKLSIQRAVEIAKNLKRATNVHKAGYGFFEAMEKYIHTTLHQSQVGFEELCQIAENILANNIGSNDFQLEIEKFLLKNYNSENLQHITDLFKGLSSYQIKTPELEGRLFQTLHLHLDDFTLKQLESLIWSMARYIKAQKRQISDYPENYQKVIENLVEKVKTKAPSMKPRGVAFAIESISSLGYKNEEIFKRLERVVISKIDEFIPHYMVKVLSSYYKMGYGSGELYDKLIGSIIQALTSEGEGLKYSDMIRFFEIFPEVSYIYDNTMNDELYKIFGKKILSVMKDKKFPTEDVCRVFNILVRISPYQPQNLSQKEAEPMMKFMAEIVGRIRHSVYDIPKEYFTQTLSNLLEFHQPEIANKFLFIIQEVEKQGKLLEEFSSHKDQIRLYWSLLQIEKGCQDPKIVNPQNLSFLNEVKLSELDARHFLLYKQLVCLSILWFDSEQNQSKFSQKLNYNQLYQKFSDEITNEKREDLINEDPATKTHQNATQEIMKILKSTKVFQEISANLSDDLMNLIDVACVLKSTSSLDEKPQLFGVLIMNPHCYIHTPFQYSGSGHKDEGEPLIRRTVDLKKDILEQLFGWNIQLIDQQDFLKTPQNERESYLMNRIDLNQQPQEEIKKEEQKEEKNAKSGGRRVKRQQPQTQTKFKSEEEAKKRAKDDLKSLLKQSGARLTCKSLQTLREDFERKKEEVDSELLFNIQKKVDEISKGVELLNEKEEVTKDIRAKIGNIRDIWKNSAGRFADISQQVDDLLQQKRYVEQVLSMLQNFLDMDSKVEELKQKLGDEEEIFAVYKQIKIMNYMRQSFLQKIESGQDKSVVQNPKEAANYSQKLLRIKEHFSAVRKLEIKFHEEVIQGNLQITHLLAKKNPSLLVKILRVIENEEITESSLNQKYLQQQEEEKKKQRIEQLGRQSEIPQPSIYRPVVPKTLDNEQEPSMKQKSILVLNQIIRQRAQNFFEAEVELDKNEGEYMVLLKRCEALVNDLKFIRSTVEPCFPPQYKIMDLHINMYKQEISEKFDSLLAPMGQMNDIQTQDPESILIFSAFMQSCQQIITDIGIQDDFFLNIQFRLEEFYPRFLDHAQSKFEEKLQRIQEEAKSQELDIMESFGKPQGKKKKQKVTYETTLAPDIFEFMTAQLDTIQESLKGEKFIEFMKRMLEQLVILTQDIVNDSLNFEPKNPKSLIQIVVRLNDLTKISTEYSKFKDHTVMNTKEPYIERVDNLLDNFFRELIDSSNKQCEVISLYVIKNEIEQDLLIHFFTQSWKDHREEMIAEILKCAGGYISDISKLINEERFQAKVVDSLYSMLVDSYLERFLIAVNQGYKKLKLPLNKGLLQYIQADAVLKRTHKDKIIQRKALIDFYGKNIEQETFEYIQLDLKHFQEFREAYKDEILQSRYTRKIQLLSLVSLMINSQDEDQWGEYEEQFWQLSSLPAIKYKMKKSLKECLKDLEDYTSRVNMQQDCQERQNQKWNVERFLQENEKKEKKMEKLMKKMTVNFEKKEKK